MSTENIINVTLSEQEIITVNVSEVGLQETTESVTVNVSDTGLRGRPGVVWRGEWSGTVDYYVGDLVRYDGTTWMCIQYIESSLTDYPDVTDSWEMFSGVRLASEVTVEAEGDLPGGTLQEVLLHLEDELFKRATAPTDATLEEGDLWYNTTDDQLNVYRNGSWEIIVQKDALEQGYDNITMNGGYF